MQKRQNFFPFFITFFCISILFIFLGRTGLFNSVIYLFNKSVVPIEQATYNIFTFSGLENKRINLLVEENSLLRKRMIDHENLVTENKALKDQFSISYPKSLDLIPANVVGSPGFIPGVTIPDYLIIDQGEKSGIKKGNAVIFQNNLIGIVDFSEENFSKIILITGKKTSLTAEVQNPDGINDTSGIIKGKGNYEMNFENVLLTKEIKKEMVILTLPSINQKGTGIIGGLIVGKIISIDKKPSDLFQSAEVRSFVDLKNLRKVFVIK